MVRIKQIIFQIILEQIIFLIELDVSKLRYSYYTYVKTQLLSSIFEVSEELKPCQYYSKTLFV